MRVNRILVLLLAVAGAAFLTPAAVSAAPYPAVPPPGAVSSGTVAAGGAVVFSGTGFIPGETIQIAIGYGQSGGLVKTVTASASGSFSTTVIPTEGGTATLFATGLTSGVTVTATVRVADGGDDDGDDGAGGDDADDDVALPITGTSGRTLAIAVYSGVGAIVLGAGLLWFATTRRRRAGSGDLGA
ncbi:MAG TPA: hypothetical protein VF755_18075 [Catenuloplanes sp.]